MRRNAQSGTSMFPRRPAADHEPNDRRSWRDLVKLFVSRQWLGNTPNVTTAACEMLSISCASSTRVPASIVHAGNTKRTKCIVPSM